MLYCTVLHCTALYCALFYPTSLHSTEECPIFSLTGAGGFVKSAHGNPLTSPRHVKKSKNGFGRYKSSKSGLRKRGRPPKLATKMSGGKETNEMDICETENLDNDNGDFDCEDGEKDITENSLKESNSELNLLDCLAPSGHILDANNNINSNSKDTRNGNATPENEIKLLTKSEDLNTIKNETEYNTANGNASANGNGNGNGNGSDNGHQNGNQKSDETAKRKNSSVHFDPVKNFIL